jgi:hypothetical protein
MNNILEKDVEAINHRPILRHYLGIIRSQDSSIGETTGYGLEGPGSISGSTRFLSSQLPDRFWRSSGLLSNGYP